MSWSFKADCLKKGVMLHMNEYEKYQLQWLMEHGYSLADFVKALIPHVNEVSSIEPDANIAYCLKEGFYDFKNEGFNGDIWLSEEEWKQNLNRGNEYNLTNDGMSKVKLFIEQCKVKQESILKAGLDTAKETTLPSVEDILCNVEDMIDKNGEYTNAWSISDNYLSDPLELHKDEDFVVISNERTKDNVVQLPLEEKETPIQSHEVSTPHPHYTEVNLFDVSDDVFHEEDTNDFSPWSEKSINTILRIGSGFVNGKYRIYHLYTAMNVNAKDKAIFLKNEYGIGGQTYDFKNKNQDKGSIDHDSKGLTVSVYSKDSASLFRDSESKTFSWADVSSRIERLIATGKYLSDEEMEHYNSMNKDEILPAWLLEKCGLSDYTKNSQAMERPDWMKEYEILIDRDNDYVLLRDPNENVNQVWTASGKFLSTVQLENETVDEAMEEYYYNITKGGFYIPDRIKEGYMEEDYDNLSNEDIEL